MIVSSGYFIIVMNEFIFYTVILLALNHFIAIRFSSIRFVIVKFVLSESCFIKLSSYCHVIMICNDKNCEEVFCLTKNIIK
jgi:hypothetical protein